MRITRFWHRKRETTLDNDAILWADKPLGDVPASISFGNFKAQILGEAGTSNPAEIYGGTLQYGTVTWLSGLVFEVSACGYLIDGVAYTSEQTTITLDAADATNPRIDVIYVDADGLAGKVTGTPAADPAKPEIDQSTQLEMTFVTVAALATVPLDVAATTLYLEDAGDPAEWDATETTTGARITLDDTSNPYSGAKAILFDAAADGDQAILTAGTGAELQTGDLSSLEMHMALTTGATASTNSWLRVAFFNGANRVSSWVAIKFGLYGFSNIAGYQTVTIPNADFKFTDTSADSLVFEVDGRRSATVSLSLDQVRVQAGGGITIVNITQGLTEPELINGVREFKAQQTFGAHTLTDAATIVWDLDKYPIARVTLGGDRTLSILNARAGGTYILRVTQDLTGTRLLTWDSAVNWPEDTAPTLTTTAALSDIVTMVCFTDGILAAAVGGQAYPVF